MKSLEAYREFAGVETSFGSIEEYKLIAVRAINRIEDEIIHVSRLQENEMLFGRDLEKMVIYERKINELKIEKLRLEEYARELDNYDYGKGSSTK